MPKVSVIVPVFGVEKYIERCACSLFSQTLDDIEFIFIDDSSPDASMERLYGVIDTNRPRFSEMNWCVRTERLSSNCGQAAVRRIGLSLASGDFIVHCDSDDWVEPETYSQMYEKAVVEDADCVICDYLMTDGKNDKRIVETLRCGKNEFIGSLLSRQNSWSLCNKMFRRSLFNADDFIHPVGDMGEDMVICSQLLLKANKLSYINQPFYNYRVHSSSITRAFDETVVYNNQQHLVNNSRIVLDLLKRNNLTKVYKKELAAFKYYIKASASRVCSNSKYLSFWRGIYPELNLIIPFMRINIKDKLRYYMYLAGLAPLLACRNR